jgi:hydrogenase maturation protease
MNTQPIDAIAKAVLYEGYMLYPYRPSSVKNRQRFNFGVLYQRSYSEAQVGSDAWCLQTECLVEGDSLSTIEVRVRYLKLVSRSVRALTPSQPVGADARASAPWQEAVECEVNLPVYELQALVESQREWKFSSPAKEEVEELRNGDGSIGGMIARNQESIFGVVELKAVPVAEGIFKIHVQVKNLTEFDANTANDGRDAALMRSLVSAHVVLGVADGKFISLLDPPEHLREVAASCQNVGVWPVLVGAEGAGDAMLASPIILYDYPQIAPESPGDLFDGTEIDEILALRILTMTDEEKQEMRNTDERARKMLERTENLPMEQLAKLHGTLRELHPSFSLSDASSVERRDE